ncbi:hypothetical protein [Vibrio sp. LaRot3]|uniref:hypothetical protein n=1 Tax=Vibrio sp. LaRot3 TaxID=2998829 RepID=UPI0022CDC366|nr:hypothetical protein [Vibrio sp. LaRot3]MDA0149892.1 hypothetical protein [Vibrio sp. LaRot3]
MTTTQYKIQPGDCISLIQQKFGIKDRNALLALNSDQIDDVDFIVAGEYLTLPGQAGSPLKVAVGTRTTIPEVPAPHQCGQSICDHKSPEYVDILYVPAAPKTGKQVWLAVSKEAKKAIQDEQALIKKAITKDRTQTFSALNDLGILSKFEHSFHENFLDTDQIERLKEVNWRLVALRTGAAENYQNGGEKGFILATAEQECLDPKKMLARNVRWERFCNYMQFGAAILYPIQYAIADNLGFVEEIENELQLLEKAHQKLKKQLIDHLTKARDDIHKTAIKAAGKLKTDDGTEFVFDKKRNYYTSELQQDIEQCIETLRSKNYRKKETDKFFKKQTPHRTEQTFKTWWDDGVIPACEYINKIRTLNRGQDTPMEVSAAFPFATPLLALNHFGFVVKQQVLPDEDLIGNSETHYGPKTLTNHKSYRRWRQSSSLTLDIDDREEVLNKILLELNVKHFTHDKLNQLDDATLKLLIKNTQCAASQWAYYPTLALVDFIDRTASKWLGDIKQVLGVNQIPLVFSRLIAIKKIATERLRTLEEKAKKNAEEGNILRAITLPANTLPSYKLLWDENAYKPIEKRPGIFKNNAKAADLQAVECSLISDGQVSWVRGPCWYTEPKRSNGHVKDVTNQVGLVSASAGTAAVGKTLQDALTQLNEDLEGIPKIETLINLSAEVAKYDSSPFWQDSFHWQGGMGPDGQSTYIANAQAQFFRLTSSISGDINAAVPDGLTMDIPITAGGAIKADLTLLSGQMNFKATLPLSNKDDKNNGWPLDFTYATYKTSAENATLKKFNAGSLFIDLDVGVYGLAAASCQLSGHIAVGPTDSKTGFGVKGSAFKPADYNKELEEKELAPQQRPPVAYPQSSTAEGGVKVDVFAGVEAGGKASACVQWIPPESPDNTKLELGTIDGQLAGNLGIGFSGEFRFGIQRGRMYLICAAKLVCGPGFTGKVGVSLNPINADRFVACVLQVLEEKNFAYIVFLGERDEHNQNKSFEELNQRLTVALALGLSLADVMLIPAVKFIEYQEEVLRDEYAPTLAIHINESKTQTQQWASKLPPETLAKLFGCLTTKLDKPWRESDEEKVKRLQNEVNKIGAFSKLMEWITQSGTQESQCIQFTKALMLIDSTHEQQRSPAKKWQLLGERWSEIVNYCVDLSNDIAKTKSKLDKNDISGKEQLNNSKEALERNIEIINKEVKVLTFLYTTYTRQDKNHIYYMPFKKPEHIKNELEEATLKEVKIKLDLLIDLSKDKKSWQKDSSWRIYL